MTSDIIPQVPEIPQEAIDFATELGALAAKYDLNNVETTIRVNIGFGSKYRDTRPHQNIQQNLTVSVSRVDGRGRPRTQIAIRAQMDVTLHVVREPDSTN